MFRLVLRAQNNAKTAPLISEIPRMASVTPDHVDVQLFDVGSVLERKLLHII